MHKISYIQQPDDYSCALASYAMVGKYFFPEITLEEIGKISNWEPGYVVWAFEGLRKFVSKKEFEFYMKNTKDIGSYQDDIKKVIRHPNFSQVKEKPTYENLETAAQEEKVCEIVLNSRTLRNQEGFVLHRVVILELDGNDVVYHDPSTKHGGPNQRAARDLFTKAWLDAVSEPELCIYSLA